jgi:hypothetical protein
MRKVGQYISEEESRLPEVCSRCRHWNIGQRACDAFPNLIPISIWKGENDHHKPYPGDHGIQFEPVEPKVLTKA